MPELLIGTSGWVYKHWKDVFYPPKLPGDQQLPFYAERFPTVEINFSFYRLPERSVFEGWRRRTPERFVFAVKGSRYLTHIKRLKDPDEPLERLMQNAGGLEEKLGPILFQFPPNWRFDRERMDQFLKALRPYRKHRFAFEFRHKSWLTADLYELLKHDNAALCLPVSPTAVLDVQLTADWTYVRMHRGRRGAGYSGQELAAWARRIRLFVEQGVDTYVYFNNDPDGHAVRDAERLRGMLS
jgi:uncharacterized protein YecE (DUF72 family)